MKEAKASKEEFSKYLNMIRQGKKTEKQEKRFQILICFLMEEMLSDLQKTMAQ